MSARSHVEKMGPLRGDGKFEICVKYRAVCVEKMGPRRGDGNNSPLVSFPQSACRREDGSSSWGRKPLRSIKVTKFYVM